MRILESPIKKAELLKSKTVFEGPMIKAVVDVKRRIMGIDAQLHADIEQFLLASGSKQEDLWGVNLYPEDEDFIEFDSMINIRPQQGNRSRSVEDPEMQESIREVVVEWIR